MGAKSVATVETVTGISGIQILIDFKTYPEKKFEPFMDKVIKCSTDNPFKTVPPALLANCVTVRDEYVTARTNRDANPSPANTQFLETAQLRGGKAFEELARWVADNSDNDRGIAKSFGFNLAKAVRTSATILPKPSDVEYSYGMPGTIVFKCKALGRVNFIIECSLDNGITWVQCGVSTKSFRIIASGLVRGKEYIFKIYGSNAAGPGYPYISGSIVAAV